MCLSFPYTPAEEQAYREERERDEKAALDNNLKQASHDATCDMCQITMISHVNGATSTFARLPVTSETSVMVMYPVDRKCIGKSAEYLLPSTDIPCNSGNLRGWFDLR